ncbi:MAG TPA: helix-turn-helix transcriptional regulator [Blastocatellia bacterium]|nr:helix-turn-helix transcriptional regulator [Blastocatellia bacterium]
MRGIDLKLERIRRGIRQYHLAQTIHIHPSILNQIENGKREANPKELAAILRALGIEKHKEAA